MKTGLVGTVLSLLAGLLFFEVSSEAQCYGAGGAANNIYACGPVTGFRSTSVTGYNGVIVKWEQKIGSKDFAGIKNSASETVNINMNNGTDVQFRAVIRDNCNQLYYSSAGRIIVDRPTRIVEASTTEVCPRGKAGTLVAESCSDLNVLGWDLKVGASEWRTVSTEQIFSYNVRFTTTFRARFLNVDGTSGEAAITIEASFQLLAGSVDMPSQTVWGSAKNAQPISVVGSVGAVQWQWLNPVNSQWSDVGNPGRTLSQFPDFSDQNRQITISFRAKVSHPVCGETLTPIASVIVDPSTQPGVLLPPAKPIVAAVIQNEVQVPGIPDVDAVSLLPADKNIKSISYFDGLGRITQSVINNGSPKGADIITAVAYDNAGRNYRNFLPVTIKNDGLYKADLLTLANGYNTSFYSNPADDIADGNPLSETVFEKSPLGRVIKQGFAGDTWQPVGGHPVVYDYGANSVADRIIRFKFDHTSGKIMLASATDPFFEAAKLQRRTTTNENGHRSLEFLDTEGRIVCRKVQAPNGVDRFACTYFVYDDFGNRVGIIQPAGVDTLLKELLSNK